MNFSNGWSRCWASWRRSVECMRLSVLLVWFGSMTLGIVAMNTLYDSDPTQACFVADFYHLNPVDFPKLAAASWNGIKCPARHHEMHSGRDLC